MPPNANLPSQLAKHNWKNKVLHTPVGTATWTIALLRVGVNSIPELELQLNYNYNSGIGIGIEIGGIENGIGIENPGIGIGIENRNWFFCNCYRSNY